MRTVREEGRMCRARFRLGLMTLIVILDVLESLVGALVAVAVVEGRETELRLGWFGGVASRLRRGWTDALDGYELGPPGASALSFP